MLRKRLRRMCVSDKKCFEKVARERIASANQILASNFNCDCSWVVYFRKQAEYEKRRRCKDEKSVADEEQNAS